MPSGGLLFRGGYFPTQRAKVCLAKDGAEETNKKHPGEPLSPPGCLCYFGLKSRMVQIRRFS